MLRTLVVCTSGCILRSFGCFSGCALVTVISVVFVQLLISKTVVSIIENPDLNKKWREDIWWFYQGLIDKIMEFFFYSQLLSSPPFLNLCPLPPGLPLGLWPGSPGVRIFTSISSDGLIPDQFLVKGFLVI